MSEILTAKTAPHLVLGVPSTASRQDAVTAFALRSRKVKSMSSTPFTIEDLTTALSEIEMGSRADAIALRYAVPCDPAVYKPATKCVIDGATVTATDGVKTLKGLTADGKSADKLGLVYLAASIDALLDWRWKDAETLAKECLRVSNSEPQRDEALNILAASLAMGGNADKAITALKKAVEGEWNLELQANLALIATGHDPELASSQMSHLINGAKTAEEKLRAARYAIKLWRTIEGDDLDDDDRSPMPGDLTAAMHKLLEAKDLSEEDFFEIGLFLAQIEPETLKASNAIRKSKHATSASGAIVMARATDFGDFVNALVSNSGKVAGGKAPWIDEHINQFVRIAVSQMVSDESDSRGSVLFSFRMLQNGLDCSNFMRVSLRFIMMMNISDVMNEDAGVPSDDFARWHTEAARAMTKGLPDATSEQMTMLQSMKVDAGNELGRLVFNGLVDQGQTIEKHANMLAQRMSGFLNRLSADRNAVRGAAQMLQSACDEAISSCDVYLPVISDSDLRHRLNGMKTAFQSIRSRLNQYT